MLNFFELISRDKKKPYHKIATNPGNPEVPQYGFTIDENGEEKLVVKGYVNAQEIIDSCHDDVCLSNIIARFMAGDTTALDTNKHRAFYDDITAMPHNIHEVHKLQVEMKEEFNRLPYEDRMVFNNDYSQYLDSIGNGKFAIWLNGKLQPEDVIADAKTESEVNADE